MAKDSDNSFTANDRRIKKRIDSKAGETVVEKIGLIREIAGYVDKISQLYDNQQQAASLVRKAITGFPNRDYGLNTLAGIDQRVKEFYVKQKVAYDKRMANELPHLVSLLEEELDKSSDHQSQSSLIAPSSRKKSLEDYDLGPERYGF